MAISCMRSAHAQFGGGFGGSGQGRVVQTRLVEYKHNETVLQGYLAFPEGGGGKRPGILIVHEWTGLGPYVQKRAEMLAQMGYVAFAADIYGKGVRPKNPSEAGAQAGKYKKDIPLLRGRAQAGLQVLQQQAIVDATKIAAIGYCFGGTTVLELARSGADVAAVVSFHGALDTPNAADAKNIKGKVLVLHGADDPFVPAEQVSAFSKEMKNAGVDWQLIAYGNAVHSFTNPEAGTDNSKGAAYNARADKRSWIAMKQLFDEVLGPINAIGSSFGGFGGGGIGNSYGGGNSYSGGNSFGRGSRTGGK